jgi:PadR family transcriptional regulator, regulatory protein PadR
MPHRLRLVFLEKLMTARERLDLLQGTLDMLILKSISHNPMHGFGISVRIRQMSQEVLQVEQGSLYPALYRLENRGWIKSEWGVSDNNRRAKFYELTTAGRKQLEMETANWERLSSAINLVLATG